MATSEVVMRALATTMISVEKLIPTRDNPRKVSAQDPAVVSLAESIAAHGLLVPLLARPHPKKPGCYDLRAGHRRLVAAQIAGLAKVPVVVRDLDDQAAIEVTVTENLQRENLSPLEEARSIQLLLGAAGWDHRAVAAHLGKSEKWVARRANLVKLSATWQKALSDPEALASRLSAGHLDVVARLPDAMQDDLLHWQGQANYATLPTIAELERAVGELRTLGGMPWDISDATLLPKAGACTACNKRTSAMPLLFDEEVEELAKGKGARKVDRCLDAECYERKLAAHVKVMRAELTVAGKAPVLMGARGGERIPALVEQFDSKEIISDPWNYTRAKKSDPEAIPAICDGGPEAGRVQWVKPIASTGGGSAARGGEGRPGPTPLKVRRENLQRRRAAWVMDQVCKDLEELIQNGAVGEVIGARPQLNVQALAVAWLGDSVVPQVAQDFGVRDWKLYDKLVGGDFDALELLLEKVIYTWLEVLLSPRLRHDAVAALPEIERAVCEIWGQVCWKDYLAAAAIELPEPKSWAALNADGTPKAQKAQKGKKAKGKAKPVA